ncbi:endonuclease 4 [Anaeramoeba ignava]|uniref:Endonuclease 4 n=1 Tax=Anaeramoeba ignava TaxID=1746090 RepID=A0A9Q0LED3_ANAIG|nr:endonuclease 4 [Anaeramoeba ignava]
MNFLGIILSFYLIIVGFCWWGNGHMIIVEIATRDLTEEQKELLMNILDTWEPYFTGDFYEASVWPDEIKAAPYNISSMSNWHFADIPYNPENISINFTMPTENVMWACNQSLNTLQSPNCTSIWAWAFQLRQLIHFVGDLHQPLHCCQMYSPLFPNGDQGGNLFLLTGDSPCNTRLHFWWDSVACEYLGVYPLDEEGIQYLIGNATSIMNKYPKIWFKDRFNDSNFDFVAWGTETYQLAVDYAYTDIVVNGTASDFYKERTIKISQQQIALAGYRLGSILLSIIDNVPKFPNYLFKCPSYFPPFLF